MEPAGQDGALTVLVTNLVLDARTGTELYARDLAQGLRRAGHRPVVYTPRPGPLADEMVRMGLPVVDDLRSIGGPVDVIHGHHLPVLLAALEWFPGVPAVGFSHARFAWHDEAVVHPRVRCWAAVSEAIRDRLVLRHGVPEDRAMVLPNAVDLDRFRPRGPLPERPRRALVLSHEARSGSFLDPVRDACARTGLELDVVGRGVGHVTDRPEEVLRGYDLVFATGRSAVEALAVGCAVVVCGRPGIGGMVRSADVERWRTVNFVGRDALDAARLVDEIAAYDTRDAAACSLRVREVSGWEALVARLVELYREVIAEQAAAVPDPEVERWAVARGLAAVVRGVAGVEDLYRGELETLTAARAAIEADRDRLLEERPTLVMQRDRLARELAVMEGDRDRLLAELEAVRADRDRLLQDLARAEARGQGWRSLARRVLRRR